MSEIHFGFFMFAIDPEKKINFRMNLCLVSSEPWVQVPKYFDLANIERSFSVRVDPEGLPPGVHYARYVGKKIHHLQFFVQLWCITGFKFNNFSVGLKHLTPKTCPVGQCFLFILPWFSQLPWVSDPSSDLA